LCYKIFYFRAESITDDERIKSEMERKTEYKTAKAVGITNKIVHTIDGVNVTGMNNDPLKQPVHSVEAIGITDTDAQNIGGVNVTGVKDNSSNIQHSVKATGITGTSAQNIGGVDVTGVKNNSSNINSVEAVGIADTNVHSIDGVKVTGVEGNFSNIHSVKATGIGGTRQRIDYISNITVIGVDNSQPQSTDSPTSKSMERGDLDMK
jgi:hypothetical protein